MASESTNTNIPSLLLMLTAPACCLTGKAEHFTIVNALTKQLSWLSRICMTKCFILEAVIHPALYLNHNLDLLWSLVASSTESAIFWVTLTETDYMLPIIYGTPFIQTLSPLMILEVAENPN